MNRAKAIEARNKEIAKLFVFGIANHQTYLRRPVIKGSNGQ
jgi:hypothetical protein